MSDQDALKEIQNGSNPEGFTEISNNMISLNGTTAYEQISIINDSTKFTEIMKDQE